MTERLEAMADELRPYMPEYQDRWQQNDDWERQLQRVRDYMRWRPDHVRQHVLEVFDLPGLYRLRLDRSPAGAGRIRINSLLVDPETPGVGDPPYPWEGAYFQGVPVTVTAVAAPGHRFVRWEGLPPGSRPGANPVTLTLSEDTALTAVFGGRS
jgi:hypothetical protein